MAPNESHKSTKKPKKTILVAPLHWGLGHATRCIPLIESLVEDGYDVLLGSDGAALMFLQKEFPELPSLTLPAYNITYTKKGSSFKWKMLAKLPDIKKTMKAERRVVAELVSQNKIQGIISDNRMGVYHKEIPCVYITHQLNVLSGKTSFVSTKLHQKIISKYEECWVPDVSGPINLSGKLGHLQHSSLPLKYIGPLSRMTKKNLQKKYDILCLLSGPEPQRSLLEEKLISEFHKTNKRVALVRGVVEGLATVKTNKNITEFNFLGTRALEVLIGESELVVSRSGYTTIMDLSVLQKPAFFIPTPGQYEQEYLAKRLKKQGLVPSCKQEKFTVKKLEKVKLYKGLGGFSKTEDYSPLFSLFEGK
tara:strand:- start:674752 stop:675843 length:1092 start_codon:yes stop_codon:yes gene_type:complete